jgi:hypothetical protein
MRISRTWAGVVATADAGTAPNASAAKSDLAEARKKEIAMELVSSGIRAAAMKKATTPAQGGNEKTYLNAFLDVRKAVMKKEEAHAETGRVDTEQRTFLNAGNYDLKTPLKWSVYGADDKYEITS